MSAERGWNRVCGRALRPYQLEQNGSLPNGHNPFGVPGQRPAGDDWVKLTHNTLEKLYFSGWPAYLRMPNF